MSKIFVYYCCVSEIDLTGEKINQVSRVYEFKSHDIKLHYSKIDALKDLRHIIDAHIEACQHNEP